MRSPHLPTGHEPNRTTAAWRSALPDLACPAATLRELQVTDAPSLLAHLGNLSYRVGRPLEFDAATQTVQNDAEANSLVKRPGRKEFIVPEAI